MPFSYVVVANSVIQATVEQRLNGQTVLNTLQYRTDNYVGGSSVDGESLLAAMNTKLQDVAGLIPLMRAAQSDDLEHLKLRLQVVHPIRRPYALFDTGGTGNIAQPSEPSGINAVIVKQSSNVGRGTAGAFHLGGIPQNAVSEGLLTAGYQVLLTDLADEIQQIQAITVAGVTLDLVPMMFNGTTVDNNDDIWDAYIKDTVRYMTRRTVGRGI